ncbi:hypothetical protein FOZ63_004557, partial [Perkinsus olseni]
VLQPVEAIFRREHDLQRRHVVVPSTRAVNPSFSKFSVPSELDLLKAIVELLGTPSEQTWPEASSLPSFHEFAYLPEPDNWPQEMSGDACKESEKYADVEPVGAAIQC